MVCSIYLHWELKLFMSDANLFLQQSDSNVSSHQLTSWWGNLSLALPWEEDGIWDIQGSLRIQRADRRQSAKVRGKRKKSRLIWPTPQHTEAIAFSYRCQHVHGIAAFKLLSLMVLICSFNILQGHEFHALTQLLISRTDSADRKRPKSKSLFPPFLHWWITLNFFLEIKALSWVVVCVSDRESYAGICWHRLLSPRGDVPVQERPILRWSGPAAEAGVYLWSVEAAGTPLTAP